MARHIVLLIGIGLLTLLSMNLGTTVHATAPSILHVGGSGAQNYTTITEVIANATPGSLILIHPGEYHETFIVDKALELRGSGQNTTIINGSRLGNVITVTADDVIIRNLTVVGSQLMFPRAGIMVQANHTHIIDVTLTDDFYGAILSWSTSGAVFEADHIYANHRCGIYFPHSSNNLIRGNTFADNPFNGCGLYEASNGNRILNNTFARNGFCGINIRDSSDITVTGNRFEGNNIGVHVPPPLFHVSLVDNVFSGNTQSIEEELNPFVAVGLLFAGVVFLGMLWWWRRL